jgi:hypothetical protein
VEETNNSSEARSLRDALSSALRDKSALAGLTENPGWRMLRAWIEEQVRYRTDQIVLQPCRGVESQLEQEYMKGEISALRTLTAFVDTVTETADAVIGALKDVERDSPDSDLCEPDGDE